MQPACGQSATVHFYLSNWLMRVCEIVEIELSHMGKNNGNPDLAFEKLIPFMFQTVNLFRN